MKKSIKNLKRIAITTLAFGSVLACTTPQICRNFSSPTANCSKQPTTHSCNLQNIESLNSMSLIDISPKYFTLNGTPNSKKDIITSGSYLSTFQNSTAKKVFANSTNQSISPKILNSAIGNSTENNSLDTENSLNNFSSSNYPSGNFTATSLSADNYSRIFNGSDLKMSVSTEKLPKANFTATQTAITYLKSPQLVATDGETLFVYDSFTEGLTGFSTNSTSPIPTAETTEKKNILSLQFSGTFLYCLATNPETHKNEIYRIKNTNGTLVYTKVQTQMENATLFAVETQTSATTEESSSTNQEVLYLLNDNKILNVETIEESGQTLSSSGSTYDFNQYARNNTTANELIVENADHTHITSLYASNGSLFLSYYELIDENSKASTCTVQLTKNASGYYKAVTNTDGSTTYFSSEQEAVNGSNFAPNKAITSVISTNQSLYLLQSNGVLQKNESGSTRLINLKNLITRTFPNRFTSITLSSMAKIGDALYFTDPNAQVIYKLTSTGLRDTIQIFMENSTPEPSLETTSAHQFIRVTKSAELYATPFSITPQFTIPSGTNLVILAKDDVAFKNYYYCLYTTKTTNYYLYLKDTTPIEYTQKTPVSTPVKVLGSSVPVFALPSTIEDNQNQIVERLQDNSILTQSVLQTVKNSHGESFYVVSTPSGNTGYVRYTQINSSKNLIATQKVKCNGRTKRETKMFLTPSPDDLTSYSDEEIAEFETLGIEDNTRVKLLEKISAGSTYTRAVYQNDSGQVFYGYIQTEDIKSDELTPLQIIGLVLVAINILLLILIIIFRKRYTSNNTPKSPTSQTSKTKNAETKNPDFEKNDAKNSSNEKTDNKKTNAKNPDFENNGSKNTNYKNTYAKNTDSENINSKDSVFTNTNYENTGSKYSDFQSPDFESTDSEPLDS